MIDPATQAQLKEAIADCIGTDQGILDALRAEIRPLRGSTRRIQPRVTTSISIVGTDGGNNQLPPANLEHLFADLSVPDLHLETSGHRAGNTGLDLSAEFTGDNYSQQCHLGQRGNPGASKGARIRRLKQ